MFRFHKSFIPCVICILVLPAPSIGYSGPRLDIQVEVDFGKDLGQDFGTLFQARDQSERLVYGAGFSAVYNTYFRGERNKLQFFVRPQKGRDTFEIEPFPRPNDIPSTCVYALSDSLYVNHKTISDGLVKYDPEKEAWAKVEGADRHGSSVSTVRGKRLEYLNGDVVYDGNVVFDPPAQPIYRNYYYGQGHLHFYRESRSEAGEIQKAVVAIPWSPYDDPIKAEIADEVVLDIFMPPEFPYSYGQIGDEVITCSNWGGLYSFDGTGWKILRKPVENVSYQVYTMVAYGDRLLMGQYPTGNYISYDGNEIQVLENWPPVPKGASPSARELQTGAIYRGELFAGVWPWAELWRLDPDTNAWIQMGRLFEYPQVHAIPVHPYEEETKSAGVVLNQLGQRLTSMVPSGDGLVMGTSWKGGETLLDEEKFGVLSKEQRDEFGALHKLRMPGALSAVIDWKDEPTQLRFVLEEGVMTLYQDGKQLASARIEDGLLGDFSGAQLTWGKGVFGPLSGEIVSKRIN